MIEAALRLPEAATATVYCYATCPGPNGCECFDADGNEKLVPASRYGLTDAQRERDEQDAEGTLPRV